MTGPIHQDSESSEDELALPFDLSVAKGKKPDKQVIQPVAPECVSCERKFEALIRSLKETTSSFAITHGEVQDALDRFKIWSGNIGANQPASNQISLDWRTRDAPGLKREILGLITQLSSALNDLYEIVTRKSINRSKTMIRNGQPSVMITEAEELLKFVSNTIGSLFRMSLLIQKITPRDRFLKANTGVRKPIDSIYDIDHVAAKFPKLNEEGFEWLRDRLGNTNTQRRQFFQYSRKHREKKSGIMETDKVTNRWPGLSPQANTRQSLRLPDTQAESSLNPTSASTLQPNRLAAARLLIDEHEDDTVSQSSFATSLGGNGTENHLRVPPLEQISPENEEFECPYCCMIVSPKSQKHWQKHVFADLRPYVCQYQDCNIKPFSDRRAWFDHEISAHRSTYKCLFCSHQPFDIEDALETHITKQHKDLYPSSGLQSLITACAQSPQSFLSDACLLCHEWAKELRKLNPHIPETEEVVVTAKQLRNHVAYHMEQLALFALPRHHEEDSEGDVASDHVAVNRKADSLSIDNRSQELDNEDEDEASRREKRRRSATSRRVEQPFLSEEAIAALITSLKDKDSNVRWSAAEALGGQLSLSEEAIAALTTLLKDEDPYVRISAAETLLDRSASLTERQPNESLNKFKYSRLFMGPSLRPVTRDDFRIAIICALSLEAGMVEMVLDKDWGDDGRRYGKAPGDSNTYTTGVIAGCNVVLAYNPTMGSNNASAVMVSLLSSFPAIKVAFVVGVCGVTPFTAEQEEIVLGDCIVSTSVVSFDFGRNRPQNFQKKQELDGLGRSGRDIRSRLNMLQRSRGRLQLTRNLKYHLEVLQTKDPEQLKYPGCIEDKLFESSYPHIHRPTNRRCSDCVPDIGICHKSCADLECEDKHLVMRSRLTSDTTPKVYFDRFGASNTVLSSGLNRDTVAKATGVVAFEMDGAVILELVPATIIIKAACDYADGHKNKIWQPYAAAVAAACLKAFIQELEHLSDIRSEVQEDGDINSLLAQYHDL